MNRREFITLLGGAVAWPLAAHAQRSGKRAPRVGVLLYGTPETDPNYPSFRRGLRELGYVEGQTIVLEPRSAESKPERLPVLARELVAAKPDLIYVLGGDVAPFVRSATSTIPIVMAVSNDPVQSGLVASLRPPRRQCHRRHVRVVRSRRQTSAIPARACAATRPGCGAVQSRSRRSGIPGDTDCRADPGCAGAIIGGTVPRGLRQSVPDGAEPARRSPDASFLTAVDAGSGQHHRLRRPAQASAGVGLGTLGARRRDPELRARPRRYHAALGSLRGQRSYAAQVPPNCRSSNRPDSSS